MITLSSSFPRFATRENEFQASCEDGEYKSTYPLGICNKIDSFYNLQACSNDLLSLHQYFPSKLLCRTNVESCESRPKTITEQFTESIKKVEEERRQRASKSKTKNKEPQFKDGGLKPAPGYVPRFKYSGYLRRCTWIPYSKERIQEREAGPTEEQQTYARRDKSKFCVLMAFAGGRYNGMQYGGPDRDTIELNLFEAMVKDKWILPEHLNGMHLMDFCRASRTDHGVSAARMYCSALLRECHIYRDLV